MKRRTFFPAAAAPLAASAAAPAKNHFFELTFFRLRNGSDNQAQRLQEFLGNSMLPALQRAGIGPAGFFANLIAPDGPFVMRLLDFPSLAAMETGMAKLQADQQFTRERAAFYGAPGLPFVRTENTVLRAFDSAPAVEVPETASGRPPRVFELRNYESNTPLTLARKIQMFDDAEIAIFRKTGLQPVFFGQTIVGPNQPNLVYMVAFDDLASREKNWRSFGSHPEWQKLRVKPGLTDAEIVCNISNWMLRPLPFSPIR